MPSKWNIMPDFSSNIPDGLKRKFQRSIEEYELAQDNMHLLQSLSKREKEVLHLLAKGHNSRGVAVVLAISHHTVDDHRKSVLKKLHVKNTVEAIYWARIFDIV